MEKNPTSILVVAALLRDGEGRLLLQQALPNKRHAGMWELPGGKVESDENPRFALSREIDEELGLAVVEGEMKPAGFADHPADDQGSGVVLILYDCLSWQGEPQSREGQLWGWFTTTEATRLAMPAIDLVLLEGLAP